MTLDEAHAEILAYTLAHRGPTFLHQHAVDAITAQRADLQTKPIALVFALIGLHLHVDKGLTGKQVQRWHQRLAARKQPWPMIPLPAERGTRTAAEVLAQSPGSARDQAISLWCADVWSAYRASHEAIVAILRGNGFA